MLEKMRDYREIVKDAIGYDGLLRDIPQDRDRVDEMLELIIETVCTSKPSRIAKEQMLGQVTLKMPM